MPRSQYARDVDRIEKAPIVVRDFAEVDGDVVRDPRIVHLSVVGREVPAEPEEVFARRI